MLGSGAPILALCQKWRPFRPQFWKNNFWEHLWSEREYSTEYFKPNFRSLGTLVLISAFKWRRAGFRKAIFGPLSKPWKMGTNDPRDLKYGLKYSVEYPLPDQRCYQKLFLQNWGLKGLHFWQRAEKVAPEPRVPSIKTLKMETNGPRDLKLGLKYSVEYSLPDQRCSQKLFFLKIGV